ncbi:MAG: TRAP transporter TatT component family protein, partial [Longimicrobiales bacterium]|nr:TRAP transporter TatT component family protein [Longimicrobiales bacterium]
MFKREPTGWTTRIPSRQPNRQQHVRTIAVLLLIPLITTGCSVKRMAMNSVANALSGGEGGSNVYLTDDDPILVGQALPFSLKLME